MRRSPMASSCCVIQYIGRFQDGIPEIPAEKLSGGLVANMPHPHRDRYPRQRVLIVAINNYTYVVPCIVPGEVVELITLFPSRKATRDYLRSHTL